MVPHQRTHARSGSWRRCRRSWTAAGPPAPRRGLPAQSPRHHHQERPPGVRSALPWLLSMRGMPAKLCAQPAATALTESSKRPPRRGFVCTNPAPATTLSSGSCSVTACSFCTCECGIGGALPVELPASELDDLAATRWRRQQAQRRLPRPRRTAPSSCTRCVVQFARARRRAAPAADGQNRG